MNDEQRAQLIEALRTLPQRIFYAKMKERSLYGDLPSVKGMTGNEFMAYIESAEHREKCAAHAEARATREMLESQFEAALATARMLAVPIPAHRKAED